MKAVSESLSRLARDHRNTPMIGRSNLQQAVPLTFGYKAAVWLAGVDRHIQRLDQLRRRVLLGEFGGAVGTLASLGEQGLPVQQGVMERLGLIPPLISWHTVRDTIAEVGCFLGILCGLLDKIASDVKVMMMTELNEVQEPAGGGGRGASSTMPQKRNPISCAYITACSSVVRQHTASLLSAMNADFERATGTWEIEWLVLPEMFCLSAGALAQAKYLLSGLVVHPENMKKNLQLTDGLINTEAIMMALGPKMGRGKAHDRLAAISIAVSQGKGRLIDLLSNDPEIVQILDRSAIERLMEPTTYPEILERWSIVFWREEDTELAILSTILGALLPMVVTFLLGFVAAWRHDFGSKDASTLNRMVLAIRRAAGAFCRNRYDVAHGTQSGHTAGNRLVHWHYWSLRCGLSVFPGVSSHAIRASARSPR